MICWRASHRYRLADHIERKNIGIYSSMDNAEKAIEMLKTKSGFKDTMDGFAIKKVFRFSKPPLIDNTYWIDGFDTYTYRE